MNGAWSQLAVCVCSLAAGLSLLGWLRARSRRGKGVFHQVLFFPGDGADGEGEGPARLAAVVRRLSQARRRLDVCVFVLSCPELADALEVASRRGVRVRVILDGEMAACTGSQLSRLRALGVPVFVKPKPFLMHHKFAVVDDQVLLCGSFNWTRQAALGNNEDLIITNEPRLVQPFIGEFRKLWALKQ